MSQQTSQEELQKKIAAKKAEAKAALRDAKAGLGSAAKEVRAVTRDAKLEERKAEAREKAVAAFIRRWDNAFDKKVAAKNKKPGRRGRPPKKPHD